jgi:hypothetical protein
MSDTYHPERVPDAEGAIIEDAKLREYALNPEHEVGKHKARMFAAVGWTIEDYEELKYAILDALPHVAGAFKEVNRAGAETWEAIITIRRRDVDGYVDIVTAWEVHTERSTRLITIYPVF